MKGRTTNTRRTNDCYANGGSVRDIAGVSVKPYGSNPNVTRHARRDGEVCGVEGGASRARLDRPMRKYGGSVKREDGGAVSESARKRAEAAAAHDEALDKVGVAGLLGAGVAAGRRMPGPIGHVVRGSGLLGAGAGAFGSGKAAQREADLLKEAERLEAGEQGPLMRHMERMLPARKAGGKVAKARTPAKKG